jgi:spore coat polysaccharide biosynthesis protein SpsF
MKLGIIVQARMSSTRLPGKILRNFFQDKTLLEVLLEKLHRVPNIMVVVATSVHPDNDVLERFLLDKGENVYRGSEDDVLSRFIEAADFYGIDGVIRVCSDNPFIDFDGLIELTRAAQLNENVDYIGFWVNGKPSILTHFGFWGEFVSLAALKRTANISDEESTHEHVTYFIYHHPSLFKCFWLPVPSFLEGRDNIRLTIDTLEDMENVQSVYKQMVAYNPYFTLKDAVDYLDCHTQIKESMAHIIEQNIKK